MDFKSGARQLFNWIRLFFMLPGCYRVARTFEDCRKSRLRMVSDLLTLFFSYKTLPDNYGLCRFWEVPRDKWKYYHGSNFHFPQNERLSRTVQPIEYRGLFNDKYLCSLLCRSLGINIPHTYGVIHPTVAYRAQIRSWLDISSGTGIILKPLTGSMGEGIVLAKKTENGIFINTGSSAIPLEKYEMREGAVAQDIVVQDPRMAAFSSFSVNTLRLITMYKKGGEVIFVNGSMRSGVGDAFVDNWSAGGVSVGVDCEKGRLKKYAYDKRSKRYAAHPTSGVVFEAFPIPEWQSVRRFAFDIQMTLYFYKMLGLDIAIDEKGRPVLIEINGTPDIAALEQKAGPLLKNEAVLRAFGEYDLLVNKHQKRLYENLVKSRK